MSSQIKNQQEVWDTISESFSHTRKKPWQVVVDYIQSQPKAHRSIDLGCGNGRHTIPLAQNSKKTLGLDFSKNLLEITQKNLEKNQIKNASLLQANLVTLPLKDNSIDIGIMIASLHSIPHRSDRQQALQELYRVLKPKSSALLTVWNTNHKAYTKNLDNNKSTDTTIYWRQHKHNEPRFYHLYTKKELREELETANFFIQTLGEKTLSKTTPNDNIIAILSKD